MGTDGLILINQPLTEQVFPSHQVGVSYRKAWFCKRWHLHPHEEINAVLCDLVGCLQALSQRLLLTVNLKQGRHSLKAYNMSLQEQLQ